MIVGSIKEDLTVEKRVSLTPETAKNIIGLGLKVCIEKNYAIISNDFGPSIKKKSSYLWQKNGPGYHYSIRLKPNKVIIRYTGKAKQMEQKIKALRKRILR